MGGTVENIVAPQRWLTYLLGLRSIRKGGTKPTFRKNALRMGKVWKVDDWRMMLHRSSQEFHWSLESKVYLDTVKDTHSFYYVVFLFKILILPGYSLVCQVIDNFSLLVTKCVIRKRIKETNVFWTIRGLLSNVLYLSQKKQFLRFPWSVCIFSLKR